MFNSGNCASVPLVANIDGCGGNGNGNGMWGDGAWWVIILFALIFGWGNNGWGNGGGNNSGGTQFIPYQLGNSYTDAAIQRGFDNQAVITKLDGITQGICSLGYDQLAQMNGINQNISQTGFAIQQAINADTVANMQNTNALATQFADCCCTTQRAIDGVNYNMATNTCALQNTMNNNTRDIIESQNAGTRAILDYLCQDKISTLQAENQSLKLAASQQAQNAFISANQEAQTAELIRRLGRDVPVPAYVVPNPNCCYGTPYGVLNNGCGCNSGCGC